MEKDTKHYFKMFALGTISGFFTSGIFAILSHKSHKPSIGRTVLVSASAGVLTTSIIFGYDNLIK